MAYRTAASNNEGLINGLVKEGVITSKKVIEAMKQVDRGEFTLQGTKNDDSYYDSPQQLGYKATISAPHMHGMALEWLEPYLQPGSRALDVGSGSGFLCVCMKLMGADQVQGIEHIQELVDFSVKNVGKSWQNLLDTQQIVLTCGDGRKGVPSAAPYKAIHVGAAAAVVPEDLLSQLDLNGRMVIPVGTYSQEIILFDKDANGNIQKKSQIGVRYVPLCDKKEQWP